MATFELADSAAMALQKTLANHSWCLGVGVGKDGDGTDNCIVVVHAAAGAPVATIPAAVGNVPVKVVTREMPVAQTA